MPTDWLLDKFWPSIKQHPAVWIALAILAGYGGLRLTRTADASEVAKIRTTVASLEVGQQQNAEALETLQKKIRRASMEQEIRRIGSDLYALERDIEKYRDSGQQVPELYRRQRAELTEQRDQITRRLAQFIAANPALANDVFF